MNRLFIVAAMLLACQNMIAQNISYKVVKTFHIASAGGWDYLAVHGNRLYVSHGTQVNILDKNSGDSLGVIPNTAGVHGIAFDDITGKGFTSNGRLNNVTVFDLKTDKVLEQIATGEGPDAIMYDPFSKKIITCNGHSNDLTVINPVTNKVITTVAAGGKPETAISDGAGMLYVNIEDKSEIVSVNLNSFKVEQRWSIAPGEEPTGLAFDKNTKRLFAGCNKLLIVVNAVNGKVVKSVPIGEGCDGVAFDNSSKTIFTSNGEDGTMTVIAEKSADDFNVIENVITKKSARTITIDESTHTLYLPAADIEANTVEGQRPKMIPGSFVVLAIHK